MYSIYHLVRNDSNIRYLHMMHIQGAARKIYSGTSKLQILRIKLVWKRTFRAPTSSEKGTPYPLALLKNTFSFLINIVNSSKQIFLYGNFNIIYEVNW